MANLKKSMSKALSLLLAASLLLSVGVLLPPAMAEEVSHDDSGFTYVGAWTDDGASHATEELAAYAEYTFDGRVVDVYADKAPGMGIANIYIDGSFKAAVSLASAAADPDVRVFRSEDLGEAFSHKIRIVNAGGKIAFNSIEYEEFTGVPLTVTVPFNDSGMVYTPTQDLAWEQNSNNITMTARTIGCWAEMKTPLRANGVDLYFGNWSESTRGYFNIFYKTGATEAACEAASYPATAQWRINTGGNNGDSWLSAQGVNTGGYTRPTMNLFGNSTYVMIRVLYVGVSATNDGFGHFAGMRYSTNGTSWGTTWSSGATQGSSFRNFFNWSERSGWSQRAAYADTSDAGMSVSYTFTGSSISWLAEKAPGLGSANVSIDGGTPVTVSQTGAETPAAALHTFSGLGAGTHTIKVERASGTIRHSGFAGEFDPPAPRTSWALNTRAVGSGKITAGANGTYNPGQTVTVTATPVNGDFIGWYALNGKREMFANPNALSTTFTVPAGGGDIAIVALFSTSANPYEYDADFTSSVYQLSNNLLLGGTSVVGPSSYLFPVSDVTMTVNGWPVTVYNTLQGVTMSEGGSPFRTARFHMDKDEEVEIKITWPTTVTSVNVCPEAYNIPVEFNGREITLQLKTALKIRLDVNGGHFNLSIFPDPREVNPPRLGDPYVVNVLDYIGEGYLAGSSPSSLSGDVPKSFDKGIRDCTKAIQAAFKDVSRKFDDTGIRHTLYFPNGVYRFGTVYPKSNTDIYLDCGAVWLAAPDRNSFHASYDFRYEQDVASWIRICGEHDIKLFGRGIIDANGRSISRSGNKRVIPLFIQGQVWDTENLDRPPYLSSPQGWPGDNAENHYSVQDEWVASTYNIDVEDLLHIDGSFYNFCVTSCHDVTVTNYKICGNSYYSNASRNECDGFKINAAYNVSFDDGWLIAGDDPSTMACCGPTGYSDCYNNVVKNTVFGAYNAAYLRFAFLDHGYSYYDNLYSNIFCLHSNAGYEILKIEAFGGYHNNGLIKNITFSDWYVETTKQLLKATFGYSSSFIYKGIYDNWFDRFTMNGFQNSPTTANGYANTRLEFTFTDLLNRTTGNYVTTPGGANIPVGSSPTGGTNRVTMALSGNEWVDIWADKDKDIGRGSNQNNDYLSIGYNGNTANFTFVGTKVKMLATKGPGRGTADVYIDYRKVATVDLEASTVGSAEVVFTSKLMRGSRYNITVVYDNAQDNVYLDGFSFIKYLPGINGQDVDEFDDSMLTFSQGNWTDEEYEDGTYWETNELGAWCDYTYVGGTARLYALKGPDKGMANVYINGKLSQVVDLYAATEDVKAVFITPEGMLDTKNVIRIACAGLKNAASSGTAITMVGGSNQAPQWKSVPAADPGIDYGSGWSNVSGAFVSTIAGSAFEYEFTGGAVRWIGDKGPDGGIAKIYIDNVLVGTVDTYADAVATNAVLFEFADIWPGIYTIKVEFSSGTRLASRGFQHTAASWKTIPPTSPDITYSGAGWDMADANAWRCSNTGSWVEYTTPDNVTSVAYLASNWGDRGWAEIHVYNSSGVEVDYSAYNIVRNAWNNTNSLPLNQVDTSKGTAGRTVSAGGSNRDVMWQITGLPAGTYTIKVICMGIPGTDGNIQINFLGFAYSTGTGTNPTMTGVAASNTAITSDGPADGKFWQIENGGEFLTSKLNSGNYAWFEYKFHGTSIAWLNKGRSGSPTATIYLDGAEVGTYNISTGGSALSRVFEATGLDSSTEHTLRVYAPYGTGSSGERWFTNYGLQVIELPGKPTDYALDARASAQGTVTVGGVPLAGSEDIAIGAELTIGAAPEDGYVFDCWKAVYGQGSNLDDLFLDVIDDPTTFTMPRGDVTLVPLYKKLYTITYNYNGATGGNSVASKTLTQGQPFGELPVPIKDYNEFGGWFLDTALTIPVTAETLFTNAEDTTINAAWIPVDRSALEAALARLAALVPSQWTPPSLAAIQPVVLQTQGVYDDPGATQLEVDAAAVALNEALDSLVPIVFNYGTQPASVVLRKGMTYQININTNNPENIVYISGNANATVSPTGLVTAVKTGTAIITVLDVHAQLYFTIAINISS